MPRPRGKALETGGDIRRQLAALTTGLVALALPSVASAHATLVGTTPPDDAVVQTSPRRVTVLFSEAVETAFGSLRVYDSAVRPVDDGRIVQPTERSVAVGLRPRLARGTYTVSWELVSADGHPIQGASVFHVGARGAHPEGVEADLRNGGAPASVLMLRDGVKAAEFALLLLCAGGAFALLWPLAAADRRVRRLLYAALAGCAYTLAAVAGFGIVVQGAVAAGTGLGDATRWEVISSVLDTRYGQGWLLCGAGALTLSAVAAAAIAETSRTVEAVAFAIAAACAVTPALVGHAHASGSLATVADILHVQAAALWTGGLATVVAALLLERGSRWRLAATAVPRLSQTAVAAVAVLVVAGTISGYLEVRAVRGLWETHYGQLLLAKLALVTPLLALGAWNNRFAVPRLRSELASALERRRFVQRAGAELALMAAVVGVTAVLVAQPPARAALAPQAKPVSIDTRAGPYALKVVVDPATAGPNTIDLTLLDSAGRPAKVAAVDVGARLPSKNIGPLRFTADRLAQGRFAVQGAQLALPGDWQLRLAVRLSAFDLVEESVSVPIR
ncbi:MAG TPA: copper resistance protein CopC [Gaiellaceae bacterium]|nr:copper resistance protein CopC [Gaiellaceae bacterium]